MILISFSFSLGTTANPTLGIPSTDCKLVETAFTHTLVISLS